MKRITKQRKRINQLLHWYKQGDTWVRVHFDSWCYAWRESPEPWGWSRWGATKFNDVELACEIIDLQDFVAAQNWSDTNWSQSYRMLVKLGIII